MLYFVLISVIVYFAIAGGLILSQPLQPLQPSDGLDFSSVSSAKADGPNLSSLQLSDGTVLGVRHFPGPTASPGLEKGPLVLVIHGSGWHGGGYLDLASELAQEFEVVVPDLRGHGPNPVRRGDLDYIGQFEDDLAEIVAAYGGKERPVYLVGHSSGGGLVIRFAGGKHGSMLDKAVLIAPFLQYDAPTAKKSSTWAHVLVRRVIGLSMLNMVGIRGLNHLKMIQFRFPASVLNGPQGHTATQSYSYRLNTSFAPRRNYLGDVEKLPLFLLIAGSKDEAFDASAYEPTLSKANSKGQYVILNGAGHLDILYNKDASAKIIQFLKSEA